MFNNRVVKMMKMIIKFENIEEEFNQLMNKYNCDIIYIKKYISNKKFNIDDINDENIKLINEIYKKDFDLFNYKMINI
jgi:hypothetical protein